MNRGPTLVHTKVLRERVESADVEAAEAFRVLLDDFDRLDARAARATMRELD
jgi:hypothetical protein